MSRSPKGGASGRPSSQPSRSSNSRPSGRPGRGPAKAGRPASKAAGHGGRGRKPAHRKASPSLPNPGPQVTRPSRRTEASYKPTKPPAETFTELALHRHLLTAIDDLGFTKPTPIQAKAIPPALEGLDVLGCAATGSGKTAAFLLPILQYLLEEPAPGTRALVLSPTRELAAQIVDHFNELARHTQLRAVAVFGGVGMEPQVRALRKGVEVVVACPGRLLDHMQYPYARFEELDILVLDEADRMLDMGFLPDVERILARLPKGMQTFFFSATMPQEILRLSERLLDRPARVDVERKQAPATGIAQAIYPVNQIQKKDLLLELLQKEEVREALVFTRTKRRADRLAKFLAKKGINADRIHGDRSQGQRTRVLEQFKNGKLRVLVATDIAARGIDVEALPHVVNFDVPNIPEDYIHRVGRTARASATGEAFTFVSPEEEGDLSAIERAVGKRLPRRHVEAYAPDPNAPVSLPPARRGRGPRPANSRQRQPSKGGPGGSRPGKRGQGPKSGFGQGRSGASRAGGGRSGGGGQPRRQRDS